MSSPSTAVLGQQVSRRLTAEELVSWPAPAGHLIVEITSAMPGELLALCPGVDGIQPDPYSFSIRYRPAEKIVEGKSLRLYLASFWDRRIGVEDLASEIRDALVAALGPVALTVHLAQNPRGGEVISATAHHAGGVARQDVEGADVRTSSHRFESDRRTETHPGGHL